MIAPNKFWGALGGAAALALLVVFSWGHPAQEGVEPGARVVCQQNTLARTYPDKQFFEPLAPRVKAGDILIVAEESWRGRVGLLRPEYYIRVENQAGTILGYVPEDFLGPLE